MNVKYSIAIKHQVTKKLTKKILKLTFLMAKFGFSSNKVFAVSVLLLADAKLMSHSLSSSLNCWENKRLISISLV